MSLPVQSRQDLNKYTEAMTLLIQEFKGAVGKFPEWPDDLADSYLILAEEVGEIAKALVDYRWGRIPIDEAIKETAQSGAMCLRLLQRLLVVQEGEISEQVTDKKGFGAE